MVMINFNGFGKDRKSHDEKLENRILEEQKRLQQSFVVERKGFELQRQEYQRFLEEQKNKEQKKQEFVNLINQQQKTEKEQNEKTQQTSPELSTRRYHYGVKEINAKNESKRRLQQELAECSKTIRDIQRNIKEMYQFEPCRQLCELLINIRQNVYHNIDDIQEDLGYVIEAFGINEFKPGVGEAFDAKYHNQAYSNLQDARGKEISQIYASGFELDGEVIVKAQVKVKD